MADYQHDYNRIGAPAARHEASGQTRVFIDTSRPAIYTLVQKFTCGGRHYTNLIYRVHFPEVPWPNLSAGRNVGLLVYVTLNDRYEPLLITTLHTCGCYLALIPSSHLSRTSWPSDWAADRQEVYGERLPGLLAWPEPTSAERLVVSLRGETHRVMEVGLREVANPDAATPGPTAELIPMAALERLPLDAGEVSFFEGKGGRKGYVRESRKVLERLLISWWALDARVGEDKALGPPEETGATLYTSLKFWDRRASDIWNFPEFLNYWGWRLPSGPDQEPLQPLVSR